MVFQQFNLFNNLNVLENCIVGPMKVLEKSKKKQKNRKRIFEKLERARTSMQNSSLSGGQTTWLLCALIMQPDVLLFDEPTSALDPEW